MLIEISDERITRGFFSPNKSGLAIRPDQRGLQNPLEVIDRTMKVRGLGKTIAETYNECEWQAVLDRDDDIGFNLDTGSINLRYFSGNSNLYLTIGGASFFKDLYNVQPMKRCYFENGNITFYFDHSDPRYKYVKRIVINPRHQRCEVNYFGEIDPKIESKGIQPILFQV